MSRADASPESAIQCIGLFGNPGKPELPEAVATITDFCREANIDVLATKDLAAVVGPEINVLAKEKLVAAADVIIALGGDGTMLRAARVLGLSEVPLFGVNLGSLGYLTDVPLDELRQALCQLAEGKFSLEERLRVQCTVWRHDLEFASASALNDLVVNMGPLPRALDMEMRLDGDSLGRFLGDGVIVSTPTGSTAYNLSAGGPICHAAVECLLVAPICPHSLGIRPLIVSKDTQIELLLHETGEGALLTADGQKANVLANGDRLVFGQSEIRIRLIKFPQSNFYRVMRHKLKWGAPQRRLNGCD